MDILGLLVGILSLCGTCFAIGYQFGKDSRSGERVGILSLCGTCFAIGYQFGKDSRSGESRRDDKTQK